MAALPFERSSMVALKIGLVVHAIAAGVLTGSSTHLAIQSVRVLQGRARPLLLRIYPPVALLAWCAVFALGMWMYPTYRIAVRFAVLDVHAVWASILFDIKENLAVWVGPLLLGAWWIGPRVVDAPQGVRRMFAAVCATACAIVWFVAVSGLLVTSVRSV